MLLSHSLIPGTTSGHFSFMLGLVSGARLFSKSLTFSLSGSGFSRGLIHGSLVGSLVCSNLILHVSDLGINPGLGGSSGSFGLGTSLGGLCSNSLGFLLGSLSIGLTFQSHLMLQLEFSMGSFELLLFILGSGDFVS
jgi:hypothetical protein